MSEQDGVDRSKLTFQKYDLEKMLQEIERDNKDALLQKKSLSQAEIKKMFEERR